MHVVIIFCVLIKHLSKIKDNKINGFIMTKIFKCSTNTEFAYFLTQINAINYCIKYPGAELEIIRGFPDPYNASMFYQEDNAWITYNKKPYDDWTLIMSESRTYHFKDAKGL